MKDLYRRLGIPPGGDVDAIAMAVSKSTDPELAEVCRRVLLSDYRKTVYDRTHATLSKIGPLRDRLRLSNAPLWAASDSSDFNPTRAPDGKAQGKRGIGCVMMVIAVSGTGFLIWGAT
jgi:hypothetical protein